MKVCILTSAHSAFDDRIFHKQAKSLVRVGYEVTLVVPHERDEVIDGVRIKSVPKPARRISRMTRTVWQVFRESVRQDMEIYHFHDPELIPIGLLLRMRGKKVIYDVHEYYKKKILSKYYIPSLLRGLLARLFDLFESFASRFFNGIIVCDKITEAKFNGRAIRVRGFPFLPENIKHVNGVAGQFRIVYVGGLGQDRGLFKMIHAMEFVKDSVTLVLIGGFESHAAKERAEALEGYEKVEWLGLKPWPETMEIVSSCDLGLVLLQPVPAYLYCGENIVKLFEYMMFGLPVIGSDFPNLAAIIKSKGCGLVVDPVDVNAIAEAIQYVITHPEEAAAMGRRGREAIEKHYNWANEERKLLQLYAKLLESPCST